MVAKVFGCNERGRSTYSVTNSAEKSCPSVLLIFLPPLLSVCVIQPANIHQERRLTGRGIFESDQDFTKSDSVESLDNEDILVICGFFELLAKWAEEGSRGDRNPR